MKAKLVPIKNCVVKAKTWNPVNEAKDEIITYIDIAAVDKDLKKIVEPTLCLGSEAPSRARQLVQKNDVLVSTVRPNLNSIAVVSEKFSGATASTGYTVLRPFPEILDTQYLFHWVKTDHFINEMVKLATGQSYPAVSDKIILNSQIPLPSIEEQRRISSILDKADELRQKRQQAIEKLDQLLQATFIDMFGDPVRNPKGWDVGCIGDMLESVKYGSSDKATLEGEIPILRMNNLTYSGEMNLTDLKYITKVQADEKYLVKEGDILFNRTNSKELVGKTAVYVGPEPMAYAGYLVRGRTKVSFAPEYISAFLNSPWGKEKLQSMCKSIVGMANINAKEFQSIVLPIPPEKEQMHFKTRVLAIREKKQLLVNQLNVFETLFKSLQNQAFSGTL